MEIHSNGMNTRSALPIELPGKALCFGILVKKDYMDSTKLRTPTEQLPGGDSVVGLSYANRCPPRLKHCGRPDSSDEDQRSAFATGSATAVIVNNIDINDAAEMQRNEFVLASPDEIFSGKGTHLYDASEDSNLYCGSQKMYSSEKALKRVEQEKPTGTIFDHSAVAFRPIKDDEAGEAVAVAKNTSLPTKLSSDSCLSISSVGSQQQSRAGGIRLMPRRTKQDVFLLGNNDPLCGCSRPKNPVLRF